MDDELILPETDATDFVDSTPPKKSKNTIFIIVVAAAFLCLVGAVVYIILNKSSSQSTPQNTTEESSTKYNAKEFDEAMAMAEERLNIKDYVAVQYYTNKFSVIEYMTSTQKYRYYSILASLYSEEHLDDPGLSLRYTALAESALKSIRKGE